MKKCVLVFMVAATTFSQSKGQITGNGCQTVIGSFTCAPVKLKLSRDQRITGSKMYSNHWLAVLRHAGAELDNTGTEPIAIGKFTVTGLSRPGDPMVFLLNRNPLSSQNSRSPAPSAAGSALAKDANTDAVFYLASGGTDSNDGLSWAGAKASLSGILTALPHLYAGYRVRVNISAGMYNIEGTTINPGAALDLDCVAGPGATILNWISAPNAGGSGLNLVLGRNRINGCTIKTVTGTTVPAIYTVNLNPWSSSTGYMAQAFVSPTQPNMNGPFFVSSGSCISGNSEPSWSARPGETVSDGSCVWINRGSMSGEITNNVFLNWGGGNPATPVISVGAYQYGWKIERSEFVGGSGEGILLFSNAEYNVVMRNRFVGTPWNAIDVNGSFNEIKENTILNFGSASVGGCGAGYDNNGILLFATTGATVRNNAVADNVIRQGYSHAIRIEHAGSGDVEGNLIANNILDGFGACGTASAGIYLYVLGNSPGQLSSNVIANNVIRNGPDKAIKEVKAEGATASFGRNALANNISKMGISMLEDASQP